jgi:hypothetical protein
VQSLINRSATKVRQRNATGQIHVLKLTSVSVTLGQMPWRTKRRRPCSVTRRHASRATSRMPKKRAGAVAQHLGQRIGKSPWLGELQNVSVGRGVSSFDGEWRLRTPQRYATSSLHAVPNFQVSPIVRRRDAPVCGSAEVSLGDFDILFLRVVARRADSEAWTGASTIL